MKTKNTLFYFIALSGLAFSGCGHLTVSTGDGGEKVEGNGKVITQSRDVKPFSSISITGVFNVILDQGTKEAVTVETDENIQALVITEVVNDTLKLRMKDDTSIGDMKKLSAHVTVVDIKNISFDGVGTLKCASVLQLKELELNNKGVGANSLNVIVDKLKIHTESVGALFLEGKADDVSIKQEGVGVLDAFGLKANKLSLITSGVGASQVYASEELTIDASGIGGVKYKGGAKTKSIKAVNAGEVREVE